MICYCPSKIPELRRIFERFTSFVLRILPYILAPEHEHVRIIFTLGILLCLVIIVSVKLNFTINDHRHSFKGN
jgi:hypothetical protein